MRKFKMNEKVLFRVLCVLAALEMLIAAVACGVEVFSSSSTVSSKMPPFWYVEHMIYAHIREQERKLEPQFYIDEKVGCSRVLKFGNFITPPTPYHDDAPYYDAGMRETTGKKVCFMTDPSSEADVLLEKELKQLDVNEYCIYDGYIGFSVRELGLSVKESGDPDGIVWVERGSDVFITDYPVRPRPTPSR